VCPKCGLPASTTQVGTPLGVVLEYTCNHTELHADELPWYGTSAVRPGGEPVPSWPPRTIWVIDKMGNRYDGVTWIPGGAQTPDGKIIPSDDITSSSVGTPRTG
jgi:hypothetical protein